MTNNPGKRAISKDEPQPAKRRPACPEYFTTRARAAWERIAHELEAMGVLTSADGVALELLVMAYDDWRTCAAIVEQEGHLYESEKKGGNGEAAMLRANPAVAQASEAWRRVASMLSEFGLTPASRTKVRGSGKSNPLKDFLGKGRDGGQAGK